MDTHYDVLPRNQPEAKLIERMSSEEKAYLRGRLDAAASGPNYLQAREEIFKEMHFHVDTREYLQGGFSVENIRQMLAYRDAAKPSDRTLIACIMWLLERLECTTRDYENARRALPDDPPEGRTFEEAVEHLREIERLYKKARVALPVTLSERSLPEAVDTMRHKLASIHALASDLMAENPGIPAILRLRDLANTELWK